MVVLRIMIIMVVLRTTIHSSIRGTTITPIIPVKPAATTRLTQMAATITTTTPLLTMTEEVFMAVAAAVVWILWMVPGTRATLPRAKIMGWREGGADR
jgi:hypothetical protein